MATLKFENVNKIYDNNVQAVFDFNLEVKDKEFIVFVGPSGCGKSTTLRMVAGLEDITFGNLYIDNKLVNEVLPKDRDIAMVFQNYALFPHMTVYKNVAFGIRARKAYFPIYEENHEIDKLEDEIRELRKQAKVFDKQYCKKQENSSLLEKREELYSQIFDKYNEICSIRKPIMGKDERKIALLENDIQRVNNTLRIIEKDLEEAKGVDEAARANYQAEIDQKRVQIQNFQEQLDFYKNNDVPVTKLRHMTTQEIDIEVNKTARAIDLTKYLFRKPGALSGGQRQRVALGRAIVRKPKVFLMDEPLSNLDAKLRVQTRGEIIKIHERVGATTIYVTHDQTEAMTMADRIVIMKDGYIQQIGTPKEVYSNPSNTFVAGFIGSPSMNFLNGTIIGNDFVIDGPSKLSFKLNKEQLNLLKEYDKGKPLILGIRPEHCFTYNSQETKQTNSVPANCYLSELLGTDIIAYAELDGQKVAVTTNDKHPVNIHDDFTISLDESKMYFFDKESGLRIKEAL